MKRLPLTIALIAVTTAVTWLAAASIPTLAASPTPPSNTTPSAELKEILRERIERTLQEKKSPSAKNIGTLGTVKKVGTSTFTFIDTLGRERTAEISEKTQILAKNKPIKLTELSIESGVVVMGEPVDEVVMNAKRILSEETNFVEKRQALLGSITALDLKKNTVTIKNRHDGAQTVATLTTKTKFEDLLSTAITKNDLEEDQAVLVIVTPLDSPAASGATYQALRIRALAPISSPTPTAKP